MLFDSSKIEVASKGKSGSTTTTLKSLFSQLDKNIDLKQSIGNIENIDNTFFWSNGAWSAYDLLCYLLKKTGPANVYFTTYSISEMALRQLLILLDNKYIQNLSCVIDWRIKLHRPDTYVIMEHNNFNHKLSSCHSKITVIKNKYYSITVVGSANYTKNPRLEAGVITMCPNVANMYIKLINETIANES